MDDLSGVGQKGHELMTDRGCDKYRRYDASEAAVFERWIWVLRSSFFSISAIQKDFSFTVYLSSFVVLNSDDRCEFWFALVRPFPYFYYGTRLLVD